MNAAAGPAEPSAGRRTPVSDSVLAMIEKNTAFRLARVLALFAMLALSLLGLGVSAASIVDNGLRFADELVLFLSLSLSGLAGCIGLIRGYLLSLRSSSTSIALTQYLVVIGIVVALALLANLVSPVFFASLLSVPMSAWDVLPATGILLAPMLLIVDGLAQIERGNAVLKTRGQAGNTLALCFLAMALLMVASVIAVVVTA